MDLNDGFQRLQPAQAGVSQLFYVMQHKTSNQYFIVRDDKHDCRKTKNRSMDFLRSDSPWHMTFFLRILRWKVNSALKLLKLICLFPEVYSSHVNGLSETVKYILDRIRQV